MIPRAASPTLRRLARGFPVLAPTGSAQFDLMAGLTQSLAGRIGRVELLPLSGAELSAAGDGASLLPASLDALLLRGGYPALYDRSLEPADCGISAVTARE